MRLRLSGVAQIAFLALLGQPAYGLVSFDVATVLNSNATIDGSSTDGDPMVAGDGNGNWVAVWTSNDPIVDPIDSGFDIVVARSSDNGITWTAPSAIDSASGGSTEPVIATDGDGVWVVAGNTGVVARSTDNGASWTPFTSLGELQQPSIATDGAGTWIIVGRSDEDLGGTIGIDEDILLVRSVDDGVTWSPRMVLNTDAVADSVGDNDPQIATDALGTWVVVWNRSFDSVWSATSIDDGLTWSSPTQISVLDMATQLGLATDALGIWVAVWSRDDFMGAADVKAAISVDDGSTWGTPTTVNPIEEEDRANLFPSVVGDSQGTFYTAWQFRNDSFGGQLGKDTDSLISRSVDGGLTWSPPAALVPNMTSDSGSDGSPRLADDGAGSWIAMWSSRDPGDGSLGEDADIFSALSTDDCPMAPVGGCLVPTLASKSTFKAKDGKGGRDRALFKWNRGQETMLGDLGDPTATSDYLWCAYDAVSTVPTLILEKDIPAGRTCKGQPCWETTSTGFRYRDRKLEHGAVKSVTLKADVEGKAKVKVTAKGALVGLPAIPLAQAPEVKVQLHNLENGSCWEAAYSTNVRNDSVQFKAKSD